MGKLLYLNFFVRFAFLVLMGLVIPVYACSSNDVVNEDEPPSGGGDQPTHIEVKLPTADKATDLALIYHGYYTRPAWTADQIKHYVFRDKDGKPEWLFDGFLFLEIYARLNGVDYDYGIANNDKKAPGKLVWSHLLEKTFEKGKGPDAIEQTLDSLVQKGFQPPYKRKVQFGIPNPQYGVKDWGILDRKTLDFSKPEDRLTAAEWYIDRVIEEWNKKGYKYIELDGFYWVHEQIDPHDGDTALGDAALIKKVSEVVKRKGYTLTWIPYYGASGVNEWKDFGFDIAYQQPNYFFSLETPLWVIEDAIRIANRNNMSMEMEFDDRVKDIAFRKRFYTYLEQFENAKVWDNKQVAYYEGGGAFYRAAITYDPEVRKVYNALADILVRRNGKFSNIIKE